MNVTLQKHGAKKIYPVPDGLHELASDVTREVLRNQPDNIYLFISDYLETMLDVREKARGAGDFIAEVYMEGYYLDYLYRTKGVTRDEADIQATVIQANWRGYVVRKKLKTWLEKKKKAEEERDQRRSMKIEEYLAMLGITVEEATRSADIIKQAYKESKGRSGYPQWEDEQWGGEDVLCIPLGQRIQELDRSLGRYGRWSRLDFGSFLKLDAHGDIVYKWPRIGQLRKVPRDVVPPGVERVTFQATRDLNGVEQYTYVKGPIPGEELRGIPVGFVIPMKRRELDSSVMELTFTEKEKRCRMGCYTYFYCHEPEKSDLEKFYELLTLTNPDEKIGLTVEDDPNDLEATKDEKNNKETSKSTYDPNWVLPRLLVRIQKRFLLEDDDEVRFVKEVDDFTSTSRGMFTFRCETIEKTGEILTKLIESSMSVREGLEKLSRSKPYSNFEVGRLICVDYFTSPNYIQRVTITPESATGDEEAYNLDYFEYIFVPVGFKSGDKQFPPPEGNVEIPLVRFEGAHRDFLGSSHLQDQVFILGPLLPTCPDKKFTKESEFWDDFGEQAWYKLQQKLEEDSEMGTEIVSSSREGLSVVETEALEVVEEDSGWGENEKVQVTKTETGLQEVEPAQVAKEDAGAQGDDETQVPKDEAGLQEVAAVQSNKDLNIEDTAAKPQEGDTGAATAESEPQTDKKSTEASEEQVTNQEEPNAVEEEQSNMGEEQSNVAEE